MSCCATNTTTTTTRTNCCGPDCCPEGCPPGCCENAAKALEVAQALLASMSNQGCCAAAPRPEGETARPNCCG